MPATINNNPIAASTQGKIPVIDTCPGVSGPGVEIAWTGRLEILKASVWR
jgi:hypothetical protein